MCLATNYHYSLPSFFSLFIWQAINPKPQDTAKSCQNQDYLFFNTAYNNLTSQKWIQTWNNYLFAVPHPTRILLNAY